MNQAIVVVLPVFLIVMGISYICFPPPMDGKRGYRTPLSVQSKEIWDIAQKLYGKKLLMAAGMMIPLVVIRVMLEDSLAYSLLFLLFELVILCFAAVSTAQALLHKMRGRK